MNILICNDDGYLAPGIAILARVAAEFANVRVVAPERDRSGVSNSLTLDRPLRIRQAENGFYYVSGTPTDCIHLGLHALPEFQPDLVLSGINNGANMGDDTLYSGTVAAATEAYLMGIPAVAISLNDFSGRHWETAEKAAWLLLEHSLKTRRNALCCGTSISQPSRRKTFKALKSRAWGDVTTRKALCRRPIPAVSRCIGLVQSAIFPTANKARISASAKPVSLR